MRARFQLLRAEHGLVIPASAKLKTVSKPEVACLSLMAQSGELRTRHRSPESECHLSPIVSEPNLLHSHPSQLRCCFAAGLVEVAELHSSTFPVSFHSVQHP